MTILDTQQFTIGSTVRCSDGVCGRLRRVVIEPIDRVLTHLVVTTDQRGRSSRLVPLDLVRPAGEAGAGGILLSCSLAEFGRLEAARDAHFLSGASGKWSYRQEQMLTWPNYRLGQSAAPAAGAVGEAGVRLGEVRVQRGDHVYATDGSLGRVQGLIVDRLDHRVTHLLLDEGHIWGQKRAAIPIALIVDLREVSRGVQVKLTKAQVRGLPSIELDVQE